MQSNIDKIPFKGNTPAQLQPQVKRVQYKEPSRRNDMTNDLIYDIAEVPFLAPGQSVFHYTSAEGLAGIATGEFWVTERHFLNDRSEFSVGTEVVLDVIKSHIGNSTECDRFCRVLTCEIDRLESFGELEDEAAFFGDYVISLCLDRDNPLLWSEYSDFQGYCLEFDFDKLIASFEECGIMFHGKVLYDRSEQERTVEQAIMSEAIGVRVLDYIEGWDSLLHLSEAQLAEAVSFIAVTSSAFNMFFKRECFAGENEYRIVFSHIHDKGRVKDCERAVMETRISKGVLTPFVKMRFEPESCIKSVTIGPKNTSDIAAEGLRYFFRNKRMDVGIMKSEIPLRY